MSPFNYIGLPPTATCNGEILIRELVRSFYSFNFWRTVVPMVLEKKLKCKICYGMVLARIF
jgi:hypothetical protein